MRNKYATITHERLISLVRYDIETGEFSYIVSRRGVRKNKVGNIRPDGYIRIGIDGKSYLAQRLAWFYITKEWPEFVIDHIDGNRKNNAFVNLRSVTQQINVQNAKKETSRSNSGALGVSFHSRDGLWRARLMAGRKTIFCQCFKLKEDAIKDYIEAKRKYHEGCTI